MFSCAFSSAFALDFYSLESQKKTTFDSIVKGVERDAIVIFGETHYQSGSISTQAQLIDTLSKKITHQGSVVALEFLDYPEQQMLATFFYRYVRDDISLKEMLNVFFPLNNEQKNPNHIYGKLFEAAKKNGSSLLATNAPRAWKRVLRREGVDELESHQIPRGMKRGSDDYFERFVKAVGGHGSPDVLEGYFLAQSYTDAFMAQSIVDETAGKLTFMTVGHFHSDFGHGLPSYIKDLSSRQIITLRIVDSKGLTSQAFTELMDLKTYGPVADYLVFY